MPKLQIASGKEAIRKFEKLGYRTIRQKGSHIRLWHYFDKSKKPLTVPNYKIIDRSLLRKIIRDAGISVEEFNNL
ncbi:MAG: type II toxin-antitoxin system HicA family toxin [Patescibacteria group bacterium]